MAAAITVEIICSPLKQFEAKFNFRLKGKRDVLFRDNIGPFQTKPVYDYDLDYCMIFLLRCCSSDLNY